jgi:23S rRNA pseudouridine2457 synthase
VILTDDGRLQSKISSPKFKVEKTYLVQVEGIPEEKIWRTLRRGSELKDGLTKPAEVESSTRADMALG